MQDIEHPVAALTLDVGAHLRAVRTLYGLSQRELAKRAGVTNGLISLIEQNRVSPSVSSLKKVLDAIPMSLAEFFTLDLSASAQVFFQRDRRADGDFGGVGGGGGNCDWFIVSAPASAPPGPRKLSLGVIFLTLYIDLIGFSIICLVVIRDCRQGPELEGPSGSRGHCVAFG